MTAKRRSATILVLDCGEVKRVRRKDLAQWLRERARGAHDAPFPSHTSLGIIRVNVSDLSEQGCAFEAELLEEY